jgi:hypothetical protein
MKRNSFLIISKDLAADKSLSVTAKLLFSLLRDYRNNRTGQCNPWETTLAGKLGISRWTVMRGLEELKRAGWLEVRRGQNGNRYEFPKLQSATSQVANCNMESSKNATSDDPATLYEPYFIEQTVDASARKATGLVAREEPDSGRRSVPPSDQSNPVNPCPLPDPKPSAPARTHVNGLFETFWRAFVETGIALNDRDRAQCRTTFERYSAAEQRRIVEWVLIEMTTTWRTAQYTARPWNVLRDQGWRRVAAERTVPAPLTKFEIGLQSLREYRRRKYGDAA